MHLDIGRDPNTGIVHVTARDVGLTERWRAVTYEYIIHPYQNVVLSNRNMLAKYNGSCNRRLLFISLANVLFYILDNFLIRIIIITTFLMKFLTITTYCFLHYCPPFPHNSAITGLLFFLQCSCSAQSVV